MSAGQGGPYLAMAVICEKVLQEQDGVQSLIRIVDRFFHRPTVQPGQPMPPAILNFALVITFKAGEARGRQDLKVILEEPSGLTGQMQVTHPVLFEGLDRGVTLAMNLTSQFDKEGLYWFRILLDDREVTRVPLRLVYEPIQEAGR